MSQYAQNVPIVDTIIGQTGNTEAPVNPPLPVEQVGQLPAPESYSSSSSEKNENNRFGVKEESMPLRTVMNNILINGNTMDFIPGLRTIISEFTRNLPIDTNILVAETFIDEGGIERNLYDAGGRAVFVTDQNGKGTITVSKDFYENADNKTFVKIVAHEAVHAATQSFISKFYTGNGTLRPGITEDQVPQSVKDLRYLLIQARELFTEDQLRDAVRRFRARKDGDSNTGLSTREVETIYGVFNLYEFAALSVTEPAFQKMLASKLVPDTTLTFKQAFIDALKKVYTTITGLEFAPNSLLAKAIDTVLDISRDRLRNSTTFDNAEARRRMFDTSKDLSIEQLLKNVNAVTSSIEVSQGLSAPDIIERGPELNDTDPMSGNPEYIFAPIGFEDGILNPKLTTEDLNNKPPC